MLDQKLYFVDTMGNLCRRAYAGSRDVIRRNYSHTHLEIKTVSELAATLRAGQYAWPGGYPMYFITSDGAALSFETVRKEYASIVRSVRDQLRDGWNVVACDINWEDNTLTDGHTGKRIESAYAD